MSDLPTREQIRRLLSNPAHHEVRSIPAAYVNGELQTRAEWEATIEDDLRLLRDWAETCDHIDHHGYCQTHAVTPVDENGLCGIGRLIAAVKGET